MLSSPSKYHFLDLYSALSRSDSLLASAHSLSDLGKTNHPSSPAPTPPPRDLHISCCPHKRKASNFLQPLSIQMRMLFTLGSVKNILLHVNQLRILLKCEFGSSSYEMRLRFFDCNTQQVPVVLFPDTLGISRTPKAGQSAQPLTHLLQGLYPLSRVDWSHSSALIPASCKCGLRETAGDSSNAWFSGTCGSSGLPASAGLSLFLLFLLLFFFLF